MGGYIVEAEIVFILRQAILIAVRDAYGPTTLERALRHSELFGAEPEAVLREWRELEKHGYLEPLPGSSGKYLRLTEKGATQAEYRPGAADPFIHGVKAMG